MTESAPSAGDTSALGSGISCAAATAWLVSAQAGDLVPGGTDIALLDGIAALKAPWVLAWMTSQGFGVHDPDECMYLADERPDHLPAIRVNLGADDAAALARITREEASA
jgi:hypothetical protein